MRCSLTVGRLQDVQLEVMSLFVGRDPPWERRWTSSIYTCLPHLKENVEDQTLQPETLTRTLSHHHKTPIDG